MEEINLAITVVLYLHIDHKATGSQMFNHKPAPKEDNLPMVPALPAFK
jgi:hypothetical protein